MGKQDKRRRQRMSVKESSLVNSRDSDVTKTKSEPIADEAQALGNANRARGRKRKHKESIDKTPLDKPHKEMSGDVPAFVVPKADIDDEHAQYVHSSNMPSLVLQTDNEAINSTSALKDEIEGFNTTKFKDAAETGDTNPSANTPDKNSESTPPGNNTPSKDDVETGNTIPSVNIIEDKNHDNVQVDAKVEHNAESELCAKINISSDNSSFLEYMDLSTCTVVSADEANCSTIHPPVVDNANLIPAEDISNTDIDEDARTETHNMVEMVNTSDSLIDYSTVKEVYSVSAGNSNLAQFAGETTVLHDGNTEQGAVSGDNGALVGEPIAVVNEAESFTDQMQSKSNGQGETDHISSDKQRVCTSADGSLEKMASVVDAPRDTVNDGQGVMAHMDVEVVEVCVGDEENGANNPDVPDSPWPLEADTAPTLVRETTVADQGELAASPSGEISDDVTDSQLCALDWSTQFPDTQQQGWGIEKPVPRARVGTSRRPVPDVEDGTAVVKGLIREMSNLNKLLLKTKREIEMARRRYQQHTSRT